MSADEKFTVKDIQQHYANEAKRHGVSGTSTIQDIRTRELEVAALLPHLGASQRVLEVGCGNGYTAGRVLDAYQSIELDAFDFSNPLIELAKQQPHARGVNFFLENILTFSASKHYDAVYTQRCLQNLTSWEDQKIGLQNIVRSLKSGGRYVMQEAFLTGLNNLNEARAELDLEPIPEHWHNHFFNEEAAITYMQELGCVCTLKDAFLSGYYFGSRVLLPALMPKGKRVTSMSRLNDYFCALPSAGDFSPMKLLCFEKLT